MTGGIEQSTSDLILAQLGHFVEKQFGLRFPQGRRMDLERAVCAAAREWGSGAPEQYTERLVSGTATREEIQALANHLTVNETYFFRDKPSLEILREQVIPTLDKSAPRIWSAGCSTGEEPYSLSIILSRFGLWNATVLATDLNRRSLQKASEGVFAEWSFRATPDWAKKRYFSPVENQRWELDPLIRKMVRFEFLNLAEDGVPNPFGPFDVVFCRNVLMYLSPEAACNVVRRFHASLNPGGWLIVGPAETSHTLFADFTPVHFTNATFYRKGDAPTPPAEAIPQEPEVLALMHASIPLPEVHGVVSEAEIGVPERDRTPAMLRLARACANKGKLREAFGWCDQVISSGKADFRVHFLRAAILEEQGSLEEAGRALRKALYLHPKFAVGHFVLGNLAVKRGRRSESLKHFENALRLLEFCPPDELLPEAGGLTAGRLRELIAWRIRG